MKRSGKQNDKGFTLIEIIITIVMTAILGTMGLTYISTSLTKSAQLLNQAKKAMALQQVMENIFTDYNLNFKSDLGGTLPTRSLSDLPTRLRKPLEKNKVLQFIGRYNTP